MKKKIVVTGFGPFKEHVINASWESVKELSKTSSDKLKEDYKVELIIEELPVAWDFVTKRVPELWKEHDPLFMIHVGVSQYACCLTIESQSCNSGFEGLDVWKNFPPQNPSNCRTICTELNVVQLCSEINKNNNKCKACISNNPGHYLCAYTYYQSLNLHPNKTLFVHVPDLNVYSSSVTAEGLYFIIDYLLKNTLK